MKRNRASFYMWGPDCERVRAASEVAGPKRHGFIDGVSVDLRHEDISPDEWEPRPWWHFASDGEGSARLAFPSDRSLSVPDCADAVQLREGDTVQVASVSFDEVGPSFLHEHDTRRARAKLVVCDKSGEQIGEGIVFLYGATALRSSPPNQAFDRMAARACNLVGVPRLNDYPTPHFAARKNGLVDESAYFLRRADGYFSQLSDWLEEVAPDDEWWAENLLDLLNSAALGGYLMARSETELAEGALDREAQKQRTLSKGRLKLKDYDGRRVRAHEIWELHPTYTINRVATEIARELGKDKASVMASIWSEVPDTSPSYARALERVRAGKA